MRAPAEIAVRTRIAISGVRPIRGREARTMLVAASSTTSALLFPRRTGPGADYGDGSAGPAINQPRRNGTGLSATRLLK